MCVFCVIISHLSGKHNITGLFPYFPDFCISFLSVMPPLPATLIQVATQLSTKGLIVPRTSKLQGQKKSSVPWVEPRPTRAMPECYLTTLLWVTFLTLFCFYVFYRLFLSRWGKCQNMNTKMK